MTNEERSCDIRQPGVVELQALLDQSLHLVAPRNVSALDGVENTEQLILQTTVNNRIPSSWYCRQQSTTEYPAAGTVDNSQQQNTQQLILQTTVNNINMKPSLNEHIACSTTVLHKDVACSTRTLHEHVAYSTIVLHEHVASSTHVLHEHVASCSTRVLHEHVASSTRVLHEHVASSKRVLRST